MDWARHRRGLWNGVVFAGELDFVLSPEHLHHIHSLAQAAYPFGAADAECGEFFVAVAKPDAEYEFAAAYGVHSGDAFG